MPGSGQSAGVRHGAVATSKHVRSRSGLRHTHACAQNPSLQKLTAHADASPSQSASVRQGMGIVLVVVLVGMVHDVLVVVVVDDVDPGPTRRMVVVVASGSRCPRLVVLGPLVVVVTVTQ